MMHHPTVTQLPRSQWEELEEAVLNVIGDDNNHNRSRPEPEREAVSVFDDEDHTQIDLTRDQMVADHGMETDENASDATNVGHPETAPEAKENEVIQEGDGGCDGAQ